MNKPKKKFAYFVTQSDYPQVEVGSVLLYTQSRGPLHSEVIVNFKTAKHCGSFSMEKMGPVWVVNGKVQFEEPPAKSGPYTRGIMDACKKRKRELKAEQKRATKSKVSKRNRVAA